MICKLCGDDKIIDDFGVTRVYNGKKYYHKDCKSCRTKHTHQNYNTQLPKEYHREYDRVYLQLQRDNLGDNYVKTKLRRQGIEPVAEMVELKRAQLRLRRTIKSLSKI